MSQKSQLSLGRVDRFWDTGRNKLKSCIIKNWVETAAQVDIATIDSYELVIALSNGTIADRLRLSVQPQYRTIGIDSICVMTLQGHPRSMIFICEGAYATSY